MTLDALSDADESERDAWLQPVDALLSTFPLVQLNEDATRRFLHGQRLKLSELTIAGDAVNAPRVRVYAAARAPAWRREARRGRAGAGTAGRHDGELIARIEL